MNLNSYDSVIVVGSGFAGSIMARLLAEKGCNVKVVEKRHHIAGNMYDFRDSNGIRIQKYGPHTFHTKSDRVFAFISQYCILEPYRLKCEAVLDGINTPSPFNFKTIDQFYDAHHAERLKQKLSAKYSSGSAAVFELLNSEDDDIRDYADFLFKKDYSLYTAKQWGKSSDEIDPSVLKRVPVVFNYNDTYFYDKYEGIPRDGFTSLLGNILEHERISVELCSDALEHISFEDGFVSYDGKNSLIIFTGAIDKLFGYKYGRLPYRSLYFEYEYHNVSSYQNAAIVAYPADTAYTRITEYTKLPYQDAGGITLIAKEYPVEYSDENVKGDEPYYPVLTEASQMLYRKYLEYSKRFSNLVLCGRLADFKYYNMDQVIERVLDLFEERF